MDKTERTLSAINITHAIIEARAWAEAGDCDNVDGPVYIDVEITRYDAKGDEVEVQQISCVIDQEEPDCPENVTGHRWKDKGEPGCNGGGIVQYERCILCGCLKCTDTWATNPDTGEQGFHEVTYKMPESDEED